MFEVGARYEFRMLEGGDEILFWGVVETYEHPLLKLEDTDPVMVEMDLGGVELHGQSLKVIGKIINVTSPSFVSALKQAD